MGAGPPTRTQSRRSPTKRTVAVAAGLSESSGEPDSGRVPGLKGIKESLYPASQINLSLTFQRSGKVSAWVPVQLSPGP
jgi:hypothetical protein